MHTLLHSIKIFNKPMSAQSARAFTTLVQTVKPTIFWDVGEHIGAYSWLALEHSRTCKALLFEADATNYAALLQTIDRKQWHRAAAQNIVVAAACDGKSARMESAAAIVGAMSRECPGEATAKARRNSQPVAVDAIETITLDGLLARGYASPDIIKIKTLDAERLVINGARRVLETCSPVLIVNAASHELVRYLEGLSYRSFPFDQDNLIFVSVYF